jgi:hypothetical protein
MVKVSALLNRSWRRKSGSPRVSAERDTRARLLGGEESTMAECERDWDRSDIVSNGTYDVADLAVAGCGCSRVDSSGSLRRILGLSGR